MTDLCQAAIDLIKSFEACRLIVYPDVGDLATVGWGHRTSLPLGTQITQAQADQLFLQDVGLAAEGVDKACQSVLLTQNQRGACTSLAFNIGVGAFAGSTLLKLILSGDFAGVPAQFLRWSKIAGSPSPGLLRRRKAEAALWSAPDEP